MRAGTRPRERRGLKAALGLAAIAAGLGAQAAAAQEPWAAVGAGAVLAFERADPVPGGGALGELRVVQPAAHLHAGARGRLRLVGMLNLEGATIPQGELAPGNWGEGFVDRRHPHTYLHELVLSADHLLGRDPRVPRVSLSVGKGFAPFGTDDPMVRGFLRYPVNHHLAQILERAVAITAVRAGPIAAEVGLFDGDEPERPGQWPRIGGRFGDSWSGRIAATVRRGLEVQASHAHVHSPEHRPGAGPDQGKWSLSARWSGPVAGRAVYGLVEWARTSEAGGFFVFHSLLAEGAWMPAHHRLQYRFERTERPEEERIAAFRSLRPHLENSILGITRWTIHTIGYEARVGRWGAVAAGPLAELSWGRVTKVGGGLVDVEQMYGGSRVWSLAVGIRLQVGAGIHRMGRYAAAEGAETAAPHEGAMEMPQP